MGIANWSWGLTSGRPAAKIKFEANWGRKYGVMRVLWKFVWILAWIFKVIFLYLRPKGNTFFHRRYFSQSFSTVFHSVFHNVFHKALRGFSQYLCTEPCSRVVHHVTFRTCSHRVSECVSLRASLCFSQQCSPQPSNFKKRQC